MARAKTQGAVSRRSADRRAAPRLLVDHEVDYRSEDTYLFASIKDISATGIFVRSYEPLPPGTRLNLRFPPPPDAADEPSIELEGEVMWVNPYRPGELGSIDPGMGVRFVGLRAGARARLLELIRRIAYL